jgi:acyl-CoA reductase-like NAD-dependent aldehyde dehydrogenase
METKIKKTIAATNGNGVSKNIAETPSRIDVRKTYKLYIDGKFPRTESGRFSALKDAQGNVIANICRASRKDLKDAIVSNRKVQNDWSKRSAYNKAQILYRIAETLEGRKAQFVDVLIQQGYTSSNAKNEVNASIDLLVYYAGWSDKYIQIFSTVNPVESAHFNFSYPEPTGIVTILAPQEEALLGIISHVAPVIVGGNTCTLVAADKFPLTAIDFAEVLHASDLPGGVVNILTGNRKEFIGHASSHMDVNAIVFSDLEMNDKKTVQVNSALNVKRAVDFSKEPVMSPYRILNCQEIKTTWHPMGI